MRSEFRESVSFSRSVHVLVTTSFSSLTYNIAALSNSSLKSSSSCGWIFCCCSVTQSCPTLCEPMDCSTPGFPVHHQLPELTQTHVHRVSDAIQPSHPLLPPSPPALSLSQHQGLSVLLHSFFHLVCFCIWQCSQFRRQVAGQTQIPGVAWKEHCDAF